MYNIHVHYTHCLAQNYTKGLKLQHCCAKLPPPALRLSPPLVARNRRHFLQIKIGMFETKMIIILLRR